MNVKVVMVGTYPLNKRVISGGVEAVLVNLVEGLRICPDAEIHVISCRRELSEEKNVADGNLCLHYLPASRRLGNITFGLAEKYRIKKKIDSIKPDIIHFQNQPSYAYAFFRPPACPILMTVHGIGYVEANFTEGFSNWVRRLFRNFHEKKILQSVSDIVAVSPYVKEAVGHLTQAEIHPIDNPVDDRFFGLGNRAVEGRILFVGFVSRLKNVLDLIKAVDRVRAEIPGVQVCIAGAQNDPEYFAEIERYIGEHKLQAHVVFLGHLGVDRLGEEYEKCSLLALTSLQENSPLAIQQAMAAGKAVVATRVGGVPYLVDHGRTGYLVDAGDIDGMADSLATLLGNKALREAFGKNGRQAAQKRFSGQAVAENTRELYQKLIHEYKKGANRPNAN